MSSYDRSAEAPGLHQADRRRKNPSALITAWDIPEGASHSAVGAEEDEGLRLRQVHVPHQKIFCSLAFLNLQFSRIPELRKAWGVNVHHLAKKKIHRLDLN